MKKIGTGLAILAAGAIVLSGCGRSDNTQPPAAAGTVGTGPATGTITIWAQGAEADELPAVIAEFKKANPDVTVNVTAVPWSAAHDKYQAAIAAGTTPDIGQLGTTWMGEFAASGALATVPGDISQDAYYPGATSSTTVHGGTYGVPWYVDTPVLYYRTDLAARAGYTAPPATWDEFTALAKAYQAKAGAKYGVNLPPNDFQSLLPFAWSNGADLTSSDSTQWTLDTPAMLEALRYYQSFFTSGIANKKPSTETGAYETAFVQGTVPMFIGGPYEVSVLNKAGGAGFADKYATAVLPKGKTSTSFVGGADLVVFKNSKNPSAAWKLIQFLSQPSTQVAWYKSTGDLPSVQAAWTDPAMSSDPKLAVFGDQLKSVKAPPATSQWTQIASQGNTQLERVTVAGSDPAAALTALQSFASSVGTGS